MAKTDATWIEIDPATLPEAQREAYEEYKATYRVMKERRLAFETSVSQGVPEGKRMIFGYNFGKLSVALVEDDRKPKRATPAKQSLAEFIAAQAASGRAN